MNKKAWFIIVAQALVFIFLLGTMIKCNSDNIDELKHNISAYKSKVELVETENHELITTKESLILSEKELKEELYITKEELKTLKKALNDDIAYISKLEAQIALKDTVWMKPDTVFVKQDGTYVKKFEWKDEWSVINSTLMGSDIENSKLSIDDLNMNVPLELGLTDDYKFWAKTTNPHVTFTNINSAVLEGSAINKKEKRFHHGIYVGFGFHYGLFGENWDFGPQIGYGIEYSF